ncbi:DUF3040 domain-containing protein [Microbacterium sp. zg.Y1090]|uniref:DUF3040 domain-containing protein n=1 Tax=Microbacterium TaxID=33882 RepID=UPI00214C98C2|nr:MULTISPECIES: DUF3040 domain-containing protein [unclassified Microbacterium]MCR2811427.1 DUF3040 domain-containing protein [Microbacterium sp. zg.Y1084]MCR2819155.1 DUF3040 domain-containing protein [Microbacterium sp. zg.Y1090]MDL5487846.1 DUF3040 domain-containing protein [Microbacterium sp. zg-Y1211]WIM27455.1 DUF3040 domain-containing protein [Microbacterium sp. zg-Y1090]
MPLSEQEQRLLDEMERHLMRNDADVVSAPRDGRTLSYRNIVYGTVLVLLGLGGLIAGVSSSIVAIGVVAFIVMLGGVVLAVTPTRDPGRAPTADRSPRTGSPRSSTSFMDRMNERWDRRHGGS